jgi:PAS domain S-box-containing protein
MNWAVAGLIYAAAYAALVRALGDHDRARLIVGNIALIVPPLGPLAVIVRDRRRWRGRQAVFWSAIGAWALLWFVGQAAWASDEVLRATLLPWFRWHIVLQLSGSALPLIAIVAWPHRGAREDSAGTAAIDIAVLVFLTAFLYWSLVIAPGMDPARSAEALQSLATVGPLVRLAAVAGLLFAAHSAGGNAWRAVYLRLAAGMALAFVVLIGLSIAAVRGAYQTGSVSDVGWMLPFWFAAWAAATSPASVPESPAIAVRSAQLGSPVLLFVVVLAVPLVGYGLRYAMPLEPRIDELRQNASAFTLVCAVALVMVRLRVEQRAVQRANERVALLAAACEQTGEFITIVRGARIGYANEAFCRATGYSREELQSVSPADLVVPEYRAELPNLTERMRRREMIRAKTVLVRRNGTTFPVEWAAAPIVDASGRVTHIVGVIRDLSEELRLREQLVHSERLSAIGEFVSGVAHEVNNPLQTIIGTLGVLLREPRDAALRGDLEIAQREASRAGRIIRNLLAFVRRSSDTRVLLEVNDTIQAAVSVRAYELEQAGIHLEEQYGSNLPLVLANRDDLQQVVANLIINAQQAIALGSGRGVLTVRTAVAGNRALIEIADDGPGVPPDMVGRLFEPFSTSKAPGEGTGLGLSIALGIVNAHGGSLDLVPSDRGACFRVTLPGAGFPGPAAVH